MKTHTIKTPKAELMIVELLENTKSWEFLDGKFWADDKQLFINGFTPFHTLLGKPDEIIEDDAAELVKNSLHTGLFAHYVKGIEVNTYCYKTAKESLLSLIETEIYWDVNPYEKPANYNLWAKYGDFTQYGVGLTTESLKWKVAEQKTFDRNRSVIFKKKI